MGESWAAVLIALITGAVTVWTQRSGEPARKTSDGDLIVYVQLAAAVSHIRVLRALLPHPPPVPDALKDHLDG